MNNQKSALDDFKLEYEDTKQPKAKLSKLGPKPTQKDFKHLVKPKRKHFNPIKAYFNYLIEIIVS